MRRALFYAGIIAAVILVTFFGLGPVILADGSLEERIITLLFVLALYGILVFLFFKVKNH